MGGKGKGRTQHRLHPGGAQEKEVYKKGGGWLQVSHLQSENSMFVPFSCKLPKWNMLPPVSMWPSLAGRRPTAERLAGEWEGKLK